MFNGAAFGLHIPVNLFCYLAPPPTLCVEGEHPPRVCFRSFDVPPCPSCTWPLLGHVRMSHSDPLTSRCVGVGGPNQGRNIVAAVVLLTLCGNCFCYSRSCSRWRRAVRRGMGSNAVGHLSSPYTTPSLYIPAIPLLCLVASDGVLFVSFSRHCNDFRRPDFQISFRCTTFQLLPIVAWLPGIHICEKYKCLCLVRIVFSLPLPCAIPTL